MNLQEIAPHGTFLSTEHFHGIIIEHSSTSDTILFYQDEIKESDSGFMEIEAADMLDSIQSSQWVEIKRRSL